MLEIMIRLVPYGNIPKSYKDVQVTYITSKKTIYGFHKNAGDSKTSIVCFSDVRNAQRFKERLWEVQKAGEVLERCALHENDDAIRPYIATKTKGGSIIPLQLTTAHVVDIMKMCHLNYFDMMLVFDMNYVASGDYVFSYYDFHTKDIPTRGYMDLYLEQMML